MDKRVNENLPVKVIIVFEDGDFYVVEGIKYFSKDITEHPTKTYIRMNFEAVVDYANTDVHEDVEVKF